MLRNSLDDPAIQFEMTMVMSGTCVTTIGAMAGRMWVIRFCFDKPTLSWRFKLDRPKWRLTVFVDADHASDDMSCYHIHLRHCMIQTQSAREATVALSSSESEFYALNMGCSSNI